MPTATADAHRPLLHRGDIGRLGRDEFYGAVVVLIDNNNNEGDIALTRSGYEPSLSLNRHTHGQVWSAAGQEKNPRKTTLLSRVVGLVLAEQEQWKLEIPIF